VPFPALPAVVLLQKQDVSAAAFRAGDAFGPALRYKVFPAVDGIGKEYNCLLKGGGFLFDALILRHLGRFVK